MNVISLFNGHSGGNISLDEAGIDYDNYYSSEVDKYALQMEKHLYPNNVQMGDVRNIYYSNGVLVTDNGVFTVGPVGLLLGGSPCQSFSFAGKRNGMTTIEQIEIITLKQYLILKAENFEFEGYSYLFWEYVRILEEIKIDNPDVFFMLENVKMSKNWNIVINDSLGVEPVLINSALVSAQNRNRLYWTNIPGSELTLFGNCISQPKDKKLKLKDILQDNVDLKYYLSDKKTLDLIKSLEDNGYRGIEGYRRNYECNGKSYNIDANYNKGTSPGDVGKSRRTHVIEGLRFRRLTPVECARLQTIPEYVIDKMMCSGVSESQIYKQIGNGWTTKVIAHILQGLKQSLLL